MIWPAPPHCGQGWLIEKKPWLWASMPRPSQRGQVTGPVPGLAPLPWQVGQRSAFGTVTLTWAPLTAWSKLSWTSVSRSRPRTCCGLRRRAAAAVEDRAEDVAEVDAAEAAAGRRRRRTGLPAAAEAAEHARPASYSLRFSGSESDVVGGLRSP